MKIRFSKNQKIVAALGALIIILNAIFAVVFVFRVKWAQTEIFGSHFTVSYGKTVALNEAARRPRLSGAKYAFFAFTDEQRAALIESYAALPAASLTLRLGVENAAEAAHYRSLMAETRSFYYGFIYAEDFDAKGALKDEAKHSVSAAADLRDFLRNADGETRFDISLALDKDLKAAELPRGFFVSAAAPVRLYGLCIGEARVGFDFTGAVPFYGLAANGGNFIATPAAIDFSGCSSVFPVKTTASSVMPLIELAFRPSENGYGTREEPLCVQLNAGGEVFSIIQRADLPDASLQTALLKFPFGTFILDKNAALVSRMLMLSNEQSLVGADGAEAMRPLKTDLELLLGSRRDNWRRQDFELYEWSRFPGILFFDFRNYAVQTRFFLRLSYFAEKNGFRGQILTDGELHDKHSYNAHDYSPDALADFFSLAERTAFPLNEQEELFKEILLANALIIREGDAYQAGRGAVVSLSQESQRWLRRSFLAHESWHALFFTDEDFRNAVSAVYYTIDADSLAFMKEYWTSQPSLDYDRSDEYLMQNEFMAYLMQQPIHRTAAYFVQLANRYSVTQALPALCAYVRRTEGRTFEDAAEIIDTYVFDRWGLAAGRVSLINRE